MSGYKKFLTVGVAILVAFATISTANSASTAKPYWACLKSGLLTKVGTVKPSCAKPAIAIQLSTAGALGIKGDPGAQGLKGDTGAQGLPGMKGAPGSGGFLFESTTGETYPALSADIFTDGSQFYKRLPSTSFFAKAKEVRGKFEFENTTKYNQQSPNSYSVINAAELLGFYSRWYVTPGCASTPLKAYYYSGNKPLYMEAEFGLTGFLVEVGNSGHTMSQVKSVFLRKGTTDWTLNGGDEPATEDTCIEINNAQNFFESKSQFYDGTVPLVTYSLNNVSLIEVNRLASNRAPVN